MCVSLYVSIGKSPYPLKNRDFVTMRSWLPLGNDYLIINYSVKHPVRKCLRRIVPVHVHVIQDSLVMLDLPVVGRGQYVYPSSNNSIVAFSAVVFITIPGVALSIMSNKA